MSVFNGRFLHDLARFELFARAHCPPGPSVAGPTVAQLEVFFSSDYL